MTTAEVITENGVIQSFSVPEELFGYTVHALLVPPYPMETVLVLGYGEGNVTALMEKIWPVGIDIVGVDLREPKFGRMPDAFIKGDAEEFVKNSERVYDFVCIDLYQGKRIPAFVFSESFVDNVARITGKLLAINLTFYGWNDVKLYGKHFYPDACKTVNNDRCMFMVPKKLFEEREKITQ